MFFGFFIPFWDKLSLYYCLLANNEAGSGHFGGNIHAHQGQHGGGQIAKSAVCAELGCKLLYVSTDYVFPGTGETPWEVGDHPAPVNTYGESKLAGERAVRAAVEKHFIVRTSWVFGEGGNFVRTMLHLSEGREEVRVVADQIGSPTYAADLAILLCDMIETERYGTYHAANEGFCSWADFAAAIFALAGKCTRVQPIATAEYPTAAARPLNSRLSRRSLDKSGFKRLPPWEDALARYLK